MNTFLHTRIAEARSKQGNEEDATRYFVKALEGGDHSYRTMNGLIKILQKSQNVEIDDSWIVMIAEYALANRGEDAAKEVLQHLSEQGGLHLPESLAQII